MDIIIISFFGLNFAKSKLKVVHSKNKHVIDAMLFHMLLCMLFFCGANKAKRHIHVAIALSICLPRIFFLEPHAFPRTLVFSIYHSFGLAHLVHDIFLTITIYFLQMKPN